MAGKSLLDLVIENPNGLGENPRAQAQAAPKVFFDEYGQPYDEKGNRIEVKPQDPTLGESLLNIAESPAKMLVGAVTEPVNALQRLAENSVDENGKIAIPNPENPQNQQDVLTGLLSLYGGNAMNPGRLMEGAAAKVVEPPALRTYRGTANSGDHTLVPRQRPMFMSTSPDVAATYAGNVGPLMETGIDADGLVTFAPSPIGTVSPLDVRFSNPLEVDALGRRWSEIPYGPNNSMTSEELARHAADLGHDGLIIRNVHDTMSGDPLAPADTIVALRRGTVTSPLTGETLFSDTGKPSLMGSALAGAEGNTPIRGYRGSNQARPTDAPRSKYWASTSPEVASGYATSPYGFDAPNVTPANFNFENPMTVDAGGSYWAQIPHNGGTTTTDNLARLAEVNGHDGLIVRNVVDEMAGNDLPADSILALKRGTVTSPTTGEVLFSDTGKPSIMGSALAGAEANQPVRAFHSTDAQFDRFDPAFTDEVGFHFGNKDQAQTRQMVKGGITSFINPWSDWRTIPVDIETQNPAALSRDVQHFTGERVANQLVRDGIAPPSLLNDIAGASPEQQTKYVRDWLVSNGYDSVRYPNDFEGAGAPSYMALGTGNVRHAKTGDVLYAGAPPVVTTSDNQDQPLSLADLALIASNR